MGPAGALERDGYLLVFDQVRKRTLPKPSRIRSKERVEGPANEQPLPFVGVLPLARSVVFQEVDSDAS